jgi:hypothetical protein
MTDRPAPRRIDKPEEGMWAVRLRKGAVEVAARIYRCWHAPDEPENLMDRSYLVAEINGQQVDVDRVWTTRGRPIGQAEYEFLIARYRHAAWYEPEMPEAQPERRVDLNQLQPLF